ncbi:hypothetical protein NDU88_001099 [Pleurodeles waltl]|uniref:Uncharacterized protein n=1 Tax=Pleurodeles waltl TaxID=8319 RepID=A0AAV7LYI4_PLEWA|nr:hypothetical protein NDU88_001099 [Pleurodeles waltl]
MRRGTHELRRWGSSKPCTGPPRSQPPPPTPAREAPVAVAMATRWASDAAPRALANAARCSSRPRGRGGGRQRPRCGLGSRGESGGRRPMTAREPSRSAEGRKATRLGSVFTALHCSNHS